MKQIDLDQKSPHYSLFLQVRSLLMAREDIVETIKPRITTYSRNNSGICHVRTTEKGVDIGFLKGVKLADPDGKLTGNGKAIRVLPLTSYDEKIITFYLDQAIRLT